MDCALASAERCCDRARRATTRLVASGTAPSTGAPALIARCAGADDVVEAVRFARERELLVSVRGGGHAVAGYARSATTDS